MGTDWTYEGHTGIDDRGEFYEQVRRRRVVEIEQRGAELRLTARRVTERRILHPGGEATPWQRSVKVIRLRPLASRLAELESAHLDALVCAGSAADLLADFEASLPDGFSVVSRDAHTLLAVRERAETRERPRRGQRATWEQRETLVAHVAGPGRPVRVEQHTEHRFSTEQGEGEWVPARGVIPGSGSVRDRRGLSGRLQGPRP